MAKVKNLKVHFDRPSGGTFSISGDVNVDANGVFYFKLKEEHIDFADRYVKKLKKEDSSRVYMSGRKRDCLYAKTMDNLESAVKSICRMIAENGVLEELVIVYRISNQVSYFKDLEGNIHINGAAVDDFRKGNWKGSLCATMSADSYSVNLFAKPFCKVTQTESEKVNYNSPYHSKKFDVDHLNNDDGYEYEFLNKLNHFVGLEWPSDRWGDGLKSGFLEMPYTEQRAKFFHDFLLSMCKLADKFEVLKDEKTLLKLADSGKLYLPGISE